MPRLIAFTVLVVLAALLVPTPAAAQPAGADPAAFLPRGTTILRTVSADVDGDGRDDAVVLYSLRSPFSNVPHGGLLVLVATDGGVRPAHLFGEPPQNMRGEPVLDPNGTADLAVDDLTGDGRPEITLTVINRFQQPTPTVLVWVFGAGTLPAPSPDADGPPAPTWAGTGFKLEAFVEGGEGTMVVSPPAQPGLQRPASTIQRRATEQRLGGPAPAVEVSETYFWRGDGFRLASRSLQLPESAVGAAGSPQAAVLSFYQATGRGDFHAARALMSDDLRASISSDPSSTPTTDPSAPYPEPRIEEIRLARDYFTAREPSATDREVYVRVSMADPAGKGRHTEAGIWTTRKDGEQWRLAAAKLHKTADLVAVTDALPPGVNPIETTGGDLRGRGVEDLVVLLTAPGRFSNVDPYVLFGGPTGFEPGVPLASFVPGDPLGGPGGSIAVDDINGDGTPEITFSGLVGAHAAVLWVLSWDGSTLAPLFAEVSNSPTVGLEDLDRDGIPEIVLGQSGYCGGYASSPHLTFAFRWEGGAYRSASWRFPSLDDGIDEHATDVLASAPPGAQSGAARVCIEHMLALANAFRAKPAETHAAYQAYAEHRQQLPDDARRFVRPAYLAAPYVEADLRALLASIQSGQSPGWSPAEIAVLHDLLGDALLDRAAGLTSEADSLADRGKSDEAQATRRKASEARQAATREYQVALDLDPSDQEAHRAVGD
jgi:hypothetical protein